LTNASGCINLFFSACTGKRTIQIEGKNNMGTKTVRCKPGTSKKEAIMKKNNEQAAIEVKKDDDDKVEQALVVNEQAAIEVKKDDDVEVEQAPVVNEQAATLHELIALPKKKNDPFCNIKTGNDFFKVNDVLPKAGTAININLEDVTTIADDLKAAIIEVFNAIPASNKYRQAIQQSPTSGGVRIGIDAGIGTGNKFVISNTGRKLCLQRQGTGSKQLLSLGSIYNELMASNEDNKSEFRIMGPLVNDETGNAIPDLEASYHDYHIPTDMVGFITIVKKHMRK
jgi:hypothetical protein